MRSCWPGRRASRPPDRPAMDSDPSAVRLDATVMGRVQGVGFRYFVLREATDLGLDGWVANTMDGSVRCVAEGPRDGLDAPARAASEGPPAAIVERVSEVWMPATGTLGPFGVRSRGPSRRLTAWTIGRPMSGPVGYSVQTQPRASSLPTMEPNSASEELPALYRAVLDRVAELEAAGSATSRTRPRRGDPHLFACLGRPGPARTPGAPPPQQLRPDRWAAGAPDAACRRRDAQRRLTSRTASSRVGYARVRRDDP